MTLSSWTPRLVSAAIAASFVNLAAPTAARADALPPPETCPSGQVWVDSHSGGGCRDEAPKDCPPGWRGVTGGLCLVAVANSDGTCTSPAVATDATICFEKRMDHGNGRVHYDHPREVQVPVGIVGPAAACTGADRHEEGGKVCVGKGETPVAYVGAGADARGPRSPAPARGGCSRGCSNGVVAGDLGAVGLALAWLARRALGRARRSFRSMTARRTG